MTILEHLFFENQASFRKWLAINHDKSNGIWMIFYKKHLKIPAITYSEALEEALCFGWIDSIIKKINEEQYVRKFSPRKNTSNWSDTNKKTVVALINKGKMTPYGLNKIDDYIKNGKIDWENIIINQDEKQKTHSTPDYILNEFAKNEPALTHFNQLSTSCKQEYIRWITNAKRSETIQKRINDAITLLQNKQKLGLK